MVTLLLSQCVESHMATKVPSPIISMTKRTALCHPMDYLRKQNTRVSSGEQTDSWGRLRADLDRTFLRDQAYRRPPFGRLLQDCARLRSFDNSSHVAAASLVFQPNLHRSGFLVKCIARSGLEALKRDLHFVTQLALTKCF